VRIKLLIFCFLTFFVLSPAFCQQYKLIYYLDENLNSVEKGKAILTGKAYYESGLLKMDCYNNATEKLFLSATFTDSTLGVLQGLFRTYHDNMMIESEGSYENNDMQGIWQNWNKEGLKTDSVVYNKGIKFAYAKFTYHTNKKVYSFAYTDSLQNTFIEKYFAENGMLTTDVAFTGNKGILKVYDSSGIKADSVFSREEKEATFPGGDAVWRIYLQKNLNSLVAANNRAPAGTYNAIVKFVVNKDGTLANIEPETNAGYGAEKEVIRVIKNSPKWIPAMQYGKYVKAYRRQPITFVVESN
jgi:antitoxin component YwqK of YwqJK toxin-antitoxin module